MPLHLFVDNSNVLIEARRFAQRKHSRDGRLSREVDNSYEIDWGKFLHLVKQNDTRKLAQVPVLYGSRPPPEDSIWEQIRKEGFDVKVFDRNIRNKEKGVDMEMGMDVVERVLTVKPPDTLVLVAGDADFLPILKKAKQQKWVTEVWFWTNAAGELKSLADQFWPLDECLDYLRLGGRVPLPPPIAPRKPR